MPSGLQVCDDLGNIVIDTSTYTVKALIEGKSPPLVQQQYQFQQGQQRLFQLIRYQQITHQMSLYQVARSVGDSYLAQLV